MISGSGFFDTFKRNLSIALLAIVTLISTSAQALIYSNTVDITGWWDTAEMQIVGDRMYHVHSNRYGSPPLSSLQIYDISNPDQPVLLGEESSPVTAMDVTIDGSFAYIADFRAGLRIVDISDSTAPVEVGFFPAFPNEFMQSVAIKGQVVYTGNQLDGLRAIDVSNPGAPSHISMFSSDPDATSDLYVKGDRLYAIGKKLIIYDISTPSDPQQIGSHNFATAVKGIDIVGEIIYAVKYSDAPELEILDTTDPSSISIVGALTIDTEPNSISAIVLSLMPGGGLLPEWGRDHTESRRRSESRRFVRRALWPRRDIGDDSTNSLEEMGR